MISIQTKFIALILSGVLMASLVIGSLGAYNAQKVIDRDSAQIMSLLCREKAQSINTVLSCIEQSVDTLAAHAFQQLDSVERLKSDPDYEKTYTRQILDFARNAADNTDGAVAVYLRFNPELTSPSSGLFWSRETMYGDFVEQVPTDLSLYSPDDMEHVGWYYVPLEHKSPTWMEPYDNRNIGVKMISYVVPLYVGDEAVGVAGMDIDLNLLIEIVDGASVYKTGYAFLVDSEANVIHHREIPAGMAMDSLEDSLKPAAEELRGSPDTQVPFTYSWQGQEKQMVACRLLNGMRLGITAPVKEIDEAKKCHDPAKRACLNYRFHALYSADSDNDPQDCAATQGIKRGCRENRQRGSFHRNNVLHAG